MKDMSYYDIIDPMYNNTWKYLPVQDILGLCVTDKYMQSLCSHEDTWRFLLERDYPHIRKIGDPRQQYMYNYTYRVSMLHTLSPPDLDIIVPEHDYDITQSTLDELSKYLPSDIRRGDIVWLSNYGEYRNDGKFIYNGYTIEHLDSDVDDYGSVPSTYTIGDEFKSTHWVNVIDHNSYIWIDMDKYRDEILNNVISTGDQASSSFNGILGRFTIIFNPHIDSTLTSSQAFDDFLAQENNVVFDCLGVDTVYGENESPYILYYTPNI